MIVVDVIEEFIENMDYNLKVKNFYYDNVLNITTFYVDNYLFARDGLFLLIDNNLEVKIKSVDYKLKTITVANDYSTFTKIEIKPPYFLHGTPYATNKQLNKLTKDRKSVV